MIRRMSQSVLAPLYVLVLGLSLMAAVSVGMGCANKHKNLTVTGLPPNVSQVEVQKYYTAVGVSKTLATNTDNLMDSVILLNRNGVFPDGEPFAATIRALTEMGKAGKETDEFLATAPQYFGTAQKDKIYKMTLLAADKLSIVETQTTIGIKSKKARLTLNTLLAAVRLTIQTAQGLTQ